MTFATVCLAAGGTGGHVFPALSLARELDRRSCPSVLLSDKSGAHFHSLRRHEVDVPLVILPFPRHRGVLSLPVRLLRLFWAARSHLRRMKANVVVGFGGMFSVPLVMAAFSLRIPIILHEQNSLIGRANRWLGFLATTIALSYHPTLRILPFTRRRCRHTGLPISHNLIPRPYRTLKVPASGSMQKGYPARRASIHVLVVGGSQGAKVFSDLIPAALERLDKKMRGVFHFVQQCRKEDRDDLTRRYQTLGIKATLATFFDDIAAGMADAHVIISRAGANILAEIVHMQRPAIIVPFVYALDDHQGRNARFIGNALQSSREQRESRQKADGDYDGPFHLVEENADAPDKIASLLAMFAREPTRLNDAAAAIARYNRQTHANDHAAARHAAGHSHANDHSAALHSHANDHSAALHSAGRLAADRLADVVIAAMPSFAPKMQGDVR